MKQQVKRLGRLELLKPDEWSGSRRTFLSGFWAFSLAAGAGILTPFFFGIPPALRSALSTAGRRKKTLSPREKPAGQILGHAAEEPQVYFHYAARFPKHWTAGQFREARSRLVDEAAEARALQKLIRGGKMRALSQDVFVEEEGFRVKKSAYWFRTKKDFKSFFQQVTACGGSFYARCIDIKWSRRSGPRRVELSKTVFFKG